MLSTILNSFRVAEIRKKLIFTAAILALYRFGSYIPCPGSTSTPSTRSSRTTAAAASSNLLNTFTGGGLSRISLFALGIMPYITASIILQLLTVVSPALEKLQKEGEVGQARITQYTRYLTVGLAAAQAVGYDVPLPLAGLGRRPAGVRELHARHRDPRRAVPDGRLGRSSCGWAS